MRAEMQEIIQPVTTMPVDIQGVEEVVAAPVEPMPSTALQQVQGVASLQPVVLVFGNQDDIKRARKRRAGRQRRTLPRLKNPVTIKDIPAELVSAVLSEAMLSQTEIVVPSLWEMSFSNDDETHVA